MPYRFYIAEKQRLAYVELHGRVDGEEIAAAIEALASDPHWRPGTYTLWDCRHIWELILDQEGTQQVIHATRTMEHRLGGGKAAIVATRDLVYMAFRMLTTTARYRVRQAQTFTSMDHAIAWLGKDPSQFFMAIEPHEAGKR